MGSADRTDEREPAEEARSAPWTGRETDDFEHARSLINAVIAAYSARIGTDYGDETETLRNERRAHLELRQRITVTDRGDVQRVLDEYPQLLRTVREGAG